MLYRERVIRKRIKQKQSICLKISQRTFYLMGEVMVQSIKTA